MEDFRSKQEFGSSEELAGVLFEAEEILGAFRRHSVTIEDSEGWPDVMYVDLHLN